ncbi:MAG TPA: sugar ABC transporter ATP-binding protein [Candidatus Limnocylindrales bacterium]|nr:sugar ABC transporter ATP-binding protein [Candidatus Limnocylindrales bacterium]
MNHSGRSAPLLRLEEVSKSFGVVHALSGVTFELLPAEVHALVGENGAGKSTLVKLVTGALQADSGSIEILNRRVAHLNPGRSHKLGVACIYQQPALFPDLSVAENLRLRLSPSAPFRRVDWAESRAQAAELLELIGARISPESEVRQLSMPEQQLVEIACAVGSGARIIIMDEPTASLTQKEQHLLFGVVKRLRQNGAGVVYISHRLEEVFALADRVTVLRDGHSVGTNPIGELSEAALIREMVGRDVSETVASSQSRAGEIVLSLQNVGCAASGIHAINLDVRAGEIVALAGLVGAGRTELARVLFGITPADTGEIRLNGQTVSIGSPRQAITHGIAYLPEDRRRHGVILEMSIAQNITLSIQDRLFPGGWLRPNAERNTATDYMRALEVKAECPEREAGTLSGGNQQKVALARWLATQPRLLILDEPTQGIDVGTKNQLHRMIRELATKGVAIVTISSDLPEVLALADRIGVMRNGTLVAILPRASDADQVMGLAFGQEAGAP